MRQRTSQYAQVLFVMGEQGVAPDKAQDVTRRDRVDHRVVIRDDAQIFSEPVTSTRARRISGCPLIGRERARGRDLCDGLPFEFLQSALDCASAFCLRSRTVFLVPLLRDGQPGIRRKALVMPETFLPRPAGSSQATAAA